MRMKPSASLSISPCVLESLYFRAQRLIFWWILFVTSVDFTSNAICILARFSEKDIQRSMSFLSLFSPFEVWNNCAGNVPHVFQCGISTVFGHSTTRDNYVFVYLINPYIRWPPIQFRANRYQIGPRDLESR